MGSGEVVGALEHFQSHWHDGRKHIDTNADTMISMLSSAVSAYRKTDVELAAGVTANTTPEQRHRAPPTRSRNEP
jgi:hypothetical protein